MRQLRKLAFKIVHSSTLLLPAWKALLPELELAVRIMPRDVSTRWNSTYDMLDFAVEYRQALDDFTGDRKFGLRDFELSEQEWTIAKQLRNILEVSRAVFALSLLTPGTDLERCHNILFTLNTKSCYRYTSYRSH